ncbi:hypothetical protein GCM10022258_32780 [Aquimarina gracilis]
MLTRNILKPKRHSSQGLGTNKKLFILITPIVLPKTSIKTTDKNPNSKPTIR